MVRVSILKTVFFCFFVLDGETPMPVPKTTKKMHQQLRERVENGTYNIGEPIVPRKFRKIDSSGKYTEVTVMGRKIPLVQIRRELLRIHKEAGFVRPPYQQSSDRASLIDTLKAIGEFKPELSNKSNSELVELLEKARQQRHFMFWGDASTVMNAGHYLQTVRILYDEARYFTDKELNKPEGYVQGMVEKPRVYLFGRCPDTIEDKLTFVSTRRDDIEDTSTPIEGVHDIVRFFNGDSPEQQFESGQSTGGHHPCSNCDASASLFYDLEHSAKANHRTLEDKRKIVTINRDGKKNKVDPFNTMNATQLMKECLDQGLVLPKKCTKKELLPVLKEHLRGTYRVPALCHGNEFVSLEASMLKSFEVLSVEILHDLKEHIKNLWTELPHILFPKEKKIFEDTYNRALGNKATKRGCDYRFSLVEMYCKMKGRCQIQVERLLETLVEISEMCYALANKRHMKYVLRIHNITYLHSAICVDLFPKPKVLTHEKLFGQYFHAIAEHLARQSRQVSSKQTYAEQDERYFSGLKGISSTTSSREANHIIENGILRCQMEMKERKPFQALESKISKRAKGCLQYPDTVFDTKIQRSHHFKAHLEKIADFLLPGQGVWWDWKGKDLVFFDGRDSPSWREEGPWLAHFRSTNLKNERRKLKEAWDQICEDNITIPLLYRDIKNKRIVPEPSKDSFTENVGEICEVAQVSNLQLGDELMISKSKNSEVHEETDFEVTSVNTEVQVTGFDVTVHAVEEPACQLEKVRETVKGWNAHVAKEKPDEKEIKCHKIPSKTRKEQNANTDNSFKSKVARLIADVLGPDKNISLLDQLQSEMRVQRSNYLTQRYVDVITPLQTKILKENGLLKEAIKNFELKFVEEKGHDPLIEDYDQKTWDIYCKKEKTVKLLKYWNIHL